MTFDWDEANLQHLARHGISPVETEEVMQNFPYELEVEIQGGEERVRSIGETLETRILIVVTTYREEGLRVITAWDAPKAEKLAYLRKRMVDDEQGD